MTHNGKRVQNNMNELFVYLSYLKVHTKHFSKEALTIPRLPFSFLS